RMPAVVDGPGESVDRGSEALQDLHCQSAQSNTCRFVQSLFARTIAMLELELSGEPCNTTHNRWWRAQRRRLAFPSRLLRGHVVLLGVCTPVVRHNHTPYFQTFQVVGLWSSVVG